MRYVFGIIVAILALEFFYKIAVPILVLYGIYKLIRIYLENRTIIKIRQDSYKQEFIKEQKELIHISNDRIKIKCPYCKKSIDRKADRCPYCGADID